MSKQIVLGRVKGDKGDSGFSPIVDLSKEDGVLNISVTDIEGTKTESIVTGENVQGDMNETDTSKGSYIWNKPKIPSKVSDLENDIEAEKNTIIGIQKNGDDLTPNEYRKVNITVPTRTSELTNDSGFKTTDNNTTYSLIKDGSTITLNGSDGSSTSIEDTNTTYENATASKNGLMSSTDKVKLDDIEKGANAYVHPSYTARTGVPIENQTPSFGDTFTVSQPVSDSNGHITAINSITITIPSSVATTSIAGLESTTDKAKLDNTNDAYGTCSTVAATATKVVTLSSYSLVTNGTVAVKFTYAVPANATMNINGKGAKSIYYKGIAITGGIINAGDLAFFMYNGSQYHLLGIDSKISSSGGSGEVYSSTEPSGQSVGERWIKEYT